MSEYLDQYDRTSPYAEKRGPYDNENLVFYNDGKSRVPNNVIQDSNDKLYKRLSSKGGQMQHDWEENKPFWSGAHKIKGDTYINDFEHARNLANADYDVHRAYKLTFIFGILTNKITLSMTFIKSCFFMWICT